MDQAQRQRILKESHAFAVVVGIGSTLPSIANTGRTFIFRTNEKKEKKEVAIIVLLADGGGERLQQKVLSFLRILVP